MSEIWAILQHQEAQLYEQSGELLSEMLEVAQRQSNPTTVCALILTSPESQLPDLATIYAQGTGHVYVLAHPTLGRYSTEACVRALAWFIQQRRPLLVT